MKQFLTLLKVDLVNFLSLNMNKNKNKKKVVKAKQKKSGKVGIIIFVSFMYLLMTIYTFAITSAGLEGNCNDLGLVFATSIGFLMVIVFTFANAHSVLFKSKDFELLSSLPIKTSTIIASKLTSVSLLGYLYFSFSYLPALIFYLIYNFNVLHMICGIIVFLFGPLLVLTLSSFFSLLIGKVTEKMKHKNVITSIFYLAFLMIVMVFSFKLGYGAPDETEGISDYVLGIRSSFASINPLSNIMISSIQGNFGSLAIFGLISVLPFVLFLVVCAKMYTKINASGNQGYKNKNFSLNKEEQKVKQASPMKALISREFKTFLGTPIYLTNVALSPIIGAVIVSLGSYFINKEGASMFEEYSEIRFLFPCIIVAASSWAFGMSPATSVGINMEGRKFWLIKTLPVEDKTILWSKILFNMVLYLPFILVSSVLSIIFLKPSIIDSISLLICPIAFCLCFSFVGLLLNTRFYNIDWDNPTQAVKQGAGMLLTMVIDLGISILLIVPIILSVVFGFSFAFLSVILGILGCVAFGLLLFTKGLKNFKKISI